MRKPQKKPGVSSSSFHLKQIAPSPEPKRGSFDEVEKALKLEEEGKDDSSIEPLGKSESRSELYISFTNRHIECEIAQIDAEDIDLNFDGNKRVPEDNDTSELEVLIKKSKGNTEPVYVRPHPDSKKYKYQIIKGIRRTLASKRLSFRVSAIIAEFTDQEGFEIALHENLGSEPLNNFELAESLLDAVEIHEYSINEASKFFKTKGGKRLSRTGAYKVLDCAKIPAYIKKSISDKRDANINNMHKLKKLCDIAISNKNESRLKEIFKRGFKTNLSDAIEIVKEIAGKVEAKEEREINLFDGKSILSSDGKKIASIASQSSGSPMIRFTKMMSQENLKKIIDYTETLYKNED